MSCLRAICGKPKRSVAQASSGSALPTAFSAAPRGRAAISYTRTSFASSTDAHSLASSAPLLDNPLSRRGCFNYAVKLTISSSSSISGGKTIGDGYPYEQLAASGSSACAAQENSKAAAPFGRGLLQAV